MMFRDRLLTFCADVRGSVLILTGIAFVVLVAVGGAGYDIGRQQLVRLKVQQAADAAALAAALHTGVIPTGLRESHALMYFNLNFPATYLGVPRPTPEVVIDRSSVRVTANTEINARFIRVLGLLKLPIEGRSRAVFPGNKAYDLVMVVDESSSNTYPCPACGGQARMVYIRSALNQMLTMMLDDPLNPDVRFGLVGYSESIVDKWGLTSDIAQARTAVNSVGTVYRNYDHWGMEAGRKMITGDTNASVGNGKYACGTPTPQPGGFNWWSDCAVTQNTDVPPPRTERSDGAPLSTVKNLILITDGEIMTEPPPCVTGAFVPGCQNYAAFLEECNKIKDAGVALFVVNFVSRIPGDEATLRSCASVDPVTGQSYYYFAPTAAILTSTLNALAVKMNKSRIIE